MNYIHSLNAAENIQIFLSIHSLHSDVIKTFNCTSEMHNVYSFIHSLISIQP